ncbi:DUF2064 domain-containing protein [Microbacterium sp.]|uniref:TIGR04282 family arsenosugar biosynthesis glycosyltransferase n=1 Tax=Microbacterium sp. TaxID=51671 RepID=UPI000925F1CF|nr:DUF2064 domain-containing protein [Microbacterium sp.]MBN9193971.1 DUF2064 domain-containing protein [Microbacterium sp.]OJU57104.1 MAG: hypothetical protein BGO04_03715 [Microbacterium sp. 70-38]
MTAVLVMAKECVPGRVKTRLTPPWTPAEAAAIAAASLRDTLAFVGRLPVDRRILVFDGTPPPGIDGFEVAAQSSGGLDGRIATALDGCREPALLLGMDTPQLRPDDVAAPLAAWRSGRAGADAWIGPAADGGFWALALTHPSGDLVRGVPMSRADTGVRQRARLVDAGMVVEDLPTRTDLDDAASLAEVLIACPPTSALRRLLQPAPAHRDAEGAAGR